jgi:two-component system, cell cycle sensor histidine kinase and response regulator CckA
VPLIHPLVLVAGPVIGAGVVAVVLRHRSRSATAQARGLYQDADRERAGEERFQRLEGERRDLETQLLASQRLEALGTLAGGVAHDFNNLLTVIRANAEIAQVSLAERDTEGVAESLTAVMQASDRARDIVKQILMFSRRSAPSYARINLAAMITDTQTLLRATIPSTVQLLVEVRTADAWIDGDMTQMQQLLLNLCSNAEYSMRETNGGMLRISVDTLELQTARDNRHRQLDPGHYVRLLVRDTGVGMSDEVRERMFEPFFTTKPVGEGTGLGMAVLHGIVESHHGSVHVDSVPGRGTHFELLFAMMSPPDSGASVLFTAPLASTAVITPRHRNAVTTDAPLVLLVDDEPGILRAAERGIASAGLRVLTAPSAAAALQLLEQHDDIAVLITDQTMPGMTGIVLAERARALRPSLPIILSTGFAGRVAPELLEAVRIQSVLDKPYTLTQLTDTIQVALRQSRRDRVTQSA